jgi:hypothetical protein
MTDVYKNKPFIINYLDREIVAAGFPGAQAGPVQRTAEGQNPVSAVRVPALATFKNCKNLHILHNLHKSFVLLA